jgi:hypothetical protein
LRLFTTTWPRSAGDTFAKQDDTSEELGDVQDQNDLDHSYDTLPAVLQDGTEVITLHDGSVRTILPGGACYGDDGEFLSYVPEDNGIPDVEEAENLDNVYRFPEAPGAIDWRLIEEGYELDVYGAMILDPDDPDVTDSLLENARRAVVQSYKWRHEAVHTPGYSDEGRWLLDIDARPRIELPEDEDS